MVERKHTPGEWSANKREVIAASGLQVAQCITVSASGSSITYDEAVANACLIASAPALSQKLENCINALTFVINGWDESDPWIQKLRATRDGAQAALDEALS